MREILDLTDKRFGKWTVHSLSYISKYGDKFWNCFCDCGSFWSITGASLVHGKSKSCGCLNRPDLINKKFGNWKVIKFSRTIKYKSFWLCKCLLCNKNKEVNQNNLVRGLTKNCGCVPKSRTHGQGNTPLYSIWSSMKQRCLNPNDASYPDYGGRGIRVCKRWLKSFENFYKDKGPEYEERKKKGEIISLDRFPNVNGDYKPSNTRWATDSQQMRNTRYSTHSKNIEKHNEWRGRLQAALNAVLYTKRNHGWSKLFKYFGCDRKTLRNHIASQFKDGMNWGNHGIYTKDNPNVWQLDHIIPLNRFDLSIPSHRYKAFHYTNLRPRWGIDNLREKIVK